MSRLMSKFTAILPLAAIGGLSMQAMAAQTTVRLSPATDSYIQQSTPTTNFGTATTILARIATDGTNLTRAGYFQFDLSSLPAGSIMSAQLRVYGSHDTGGTGVMIGAFPGTTTAPWDETQINWNNALSLAGVDFNAAPIATATVTTTAQYYVWDMTSFIRSRRSMGNATVSLYPTAANTYRATFNSREATVNRPELVVTVETVQPPLGPALVGDTYTQQDSPAKNFGTATTVLIRQDSANALTRGGYFEFDLTGVPPGNVASAWLELFGSNDQGGTGASIKAIGATTTAPWSETALTFGNAQSLTGVDLSGPALSTVQVGPPPSTTYRWDVTSYIAARRAAGVNYATIVLANTVASTYRSTFNSKEAATNRPRLVVLLTPQLPPQNWPMFGQDYANTRSSPDTRISAGNAGTLHVLWRNESPNLNSFSNTQVGGIAGTPALVDGIAYVSDFNGWVRAMNASNGTELWRRQLTPTGSTLRQNTPSVAVTADTVYAAGNIGMLYALNRADGALKWSSQIETRPNARVSSSPVVFDNKVIIGSGSTQFFLAATPIFRGGVKFVNATTGAQLPYRVDMCPVDVCGGGVSVWSSAAIDPVTRTGFIGTGQAYSAPAGPYSDALVAFDIDTGAKKWVGQFEANDVWRQGVDVTNRDHDVGAAPNLFTANIPNVGVRDVVGVGSKGGYYDVYDRATGVRYWRHDFGARSNLGGMMHTAAYRNGVIYAVSNDGRVSGSGVNNLTPSPAKARAIDANTGATIWSVPLPQGGVGGVSIANGLMYFTTWDGVLHVLDTATGAQVKTVQIGFLPGVYLAAPDGFPNGSASGPAIYNGRVYVGYGWTWVLNVGGGLAALGL